jgi:hypothetical protein
VRRVRTRRTFGRGGARLLHRAARDARALDVRTCG